MAACTRSEDSVREGLHDNGSADQSRKINPRFFVGEYFPAVRANVWITVLAADILIDGLVLGAAFTLGRKQGALLTVVLTMGLVFLGPSVVSALSQAGVGGVWGLLLASRCALLSLASSCSRSC